MLFNSWIFAVFLAIVLPLYWLAPFRIQNLLLVAASYVFYGAWDWRFLGLLWISTLLDYSLALAIDKNNSPRARHALVSLAVLINLGILGIFKYWNFFVDSAAALIESAGFQPNLPTLQLILPVGISFYTFQTLSYTIDVYRRQLRPCHNLLDYALYVAYFPQLVAGPIERATRLLPQLQHPRTRPSFEQITSGVQLIFWGFIKKIVIADGLAPHVDAVYADPAGVDGIRLWLGVYGFAIQLYADFSGYTDIARGVSRLFGIELMLNFRQPYLSRNITEFWRRWHISLSTWLRDYVYVPLGGNRGGVPKTYRNLLLTTIISGFWHGAGWTFLLWGTLHGIGLTLHREFLRRTGIGERPAPRTARAWIGYLICAALTFHTVSLLWVLFRSPDFATAGSYFQGLANLPYVVDTNALWRSGMVPSCMLYITLLFLIDIPCWLGDRETPFTTRHAWYLRSLGYATALFLLAFVREGHTDAYIYFQF